MEGRRCVDQVFLLSCIVESCLEKGKKVLAAFIDLEKVYEYDRIKEEALCKMLRMYGVDGKLVRVVKSMYEDVRTAVWV